MKDQALVHKSSKTASMLRQTYFEVLVCRQNFRASLTSAVSTAMLQSSMLRTTFILAASTAWLGWHNATTPSTVYQSLGLRSLPFGEPCEIKCLWLRNSCTALIVPSKFFQFWRFSFVKSVVQLGVSCSVGEVPNLYVHVKVDKGWKAANHFNSRHGRDDMAFIVGDQVHNEASHQKCRSVRQCLESLLSSVSFEIWMISLKIALQCFRLVLLLLVLS